MPVLIWLVGWLATASLAIPFLTLVMKQRLGIEEVGLVVLLMSLWPIVIPLAAVTWCLWKLNKAIRAYQDRPRDPEPVSVREHRSAYRD